MKHDSRIILFILCDEILPFIPFICNNILVSNNFFSSFSLYFQYSTSHIYYDYDLVNHYLSFLFFFHSILIYICMRKQYLTADHITLLPIFVKQTSYTSIYQKLHPQFLIMLVWQRYIKSHIQVNVTCKSKNTNSECCKV